MKTAILIGAGDRGGIYADWARKNPAKCKITGVAEPVASLRERIARFHDISLHRQFESWHDILEEPKFADAVIIATPDRLHAEPALQALERGYHLLLEKPVALTPEDCFAISSSASQKGLIVMACHVLRYTRLFSEIKRMLDSGCIGEVRTIFHAENVAYYHMAHSYVRGNWRRSDESSPMILAKCCHDLDLIAWYAQARPVRIASFGELSHFRVENAPADAPARCTDDCPVSDECPYEAVESYLHGTHMKRALSVSGSKLIAGAATFMCSWPRLAGALPGFSRYRIWKEWPTSTITDDLTEAGIMKALREGPCGRCVYRCDNDQVDHQETIIEFENGVTASLRMHGLSAKEGRTIRIDGTRGTLRARFGGGNRIEIRKHGSGRVHTYRIRGDILGHGEGDRGIMDSFVSDLHEPLEDRPADNYLTSHLLAFAADRSRREGRVVEMINTPS